MLKQYRPRRDFKGLEKRRKKAGRYFKAGELSQAEIARRLKTTRTSVHRWYRAWREGGAEALRKAGRAGRRPLLGATELREVERALREGPLAHGFTTDLWTLPRVAKVIEQLTRVRYHSGHVWRILRRLGWSLQRPMRRAKERDEKAIRRWVSEEWPRVKKTPEITGPGLYSKTRAASRTVRRYDERGRHGVKRLS